MSNTESILIELKRRIKREFKSHEIVSNELIQKLSKSWQLFNDSDFARINTRRTKILPTLEKVHEAVRLTRQALNLDRNKQHSIHYFCVQLNILLVCEKPYLQISSEPPKKELFSVNSDSDSDLSKKVRAVAFYRNLIVRKNELQKRTGAAIKNSRFVDTNNKVDIKVKSKRKKRKTMLSGDELRTTVSRFFPNARQIFENIIVTKESEIMSLEESKIKK